MPQRSTTPEDPPPSDLFELTEEELTELADPDARDEAGDDDYEWTSR